MHIKPQHLSAISIQHCRQMAFLLQKACDGLWYEGGLSHVEVTPAEVCWKAHPACSLIG